MPPIFTPTPVLISSAAVAVVSLAVLKKYFNGGICSSTKRLDGKTVIITGATDGIGKETALDLAKRGAKIILAAQNMDKANAVVDELKAKTGNLNVTAKELDLASLRSVADFAREFKKERKNLDCLVNNAGVIFRPFTLTEDGYELTFQTNYLGHFLLTMLLLNVLKETPNSRIINVTSMNYKMVKKINFQGLRSAAGYVKTTAYDQSKLAQVMFTRKLATSLEGMKVSAFSVHPGAVRTNLLSHITDKMTLEYVGTSILALLMLYFGKNAKQGAQTTIFCAIEEGIEKDSGGYFADCRRRDLLPHAMDDAETERLWNESLQMVKNFYSEVNS